MHFTLHNSFNAEFSQFFRVASSGLCHFRGWPVQDSVVFFSLFWHIEKLGGGKNSGPPCNQVFFFKIYIEISDIHILFL